MNELEEKLWNYIDGTCTTEEEQAISALIESDEAYRLKYTELMALNTEIAGMELDEPSMGFTYKVMETIRTQNAQKPLKAAVNKYIVWGIGAFFTLTIGAILMVALSSVNWGTIDTSSITQLTSKMPPIQNYITGPVVQGFFFFDMVLGLFLLDSYFRKKLKNNTVQ